MSRLVLVSNRIPSDSSEASAGGLAVALRSALEESGGLWFGWSGKDSEKPDPNPTVERCNRYLRATIDLSKDEFRGYYKEFSNRTLWPLMHGRLDLCQPDKEAYRTYRQVNRRFAGAVHSLLQPNDKIWVHDYHLIPFGKKLRQLGVTTPLGLFLHIPFPQTDIIRALPWHRELLSDLCAYDLVGFQTAACAENFRNAVAQFLDGGVWNDGSVRVNGHVVEADSFPISIDTRAFADMAQSPEIGRRCKKLRNCRGEQDWICGVERLDYSKGLIERFRAFETLLDRTPALHGQVSLVQIAAPSRENVVEYQEMRRQLESVSGRINGHFGTFDWTPIRYLNKSYHQEQLAALYRESRVGLVTPLTDGMNLVAKEYIAAQDPKDPGVLVLSRFAGAAQELKDALLVNPYDIESVARAIQDALEMPLAERKQRWERMIRHLEFHDVRRWRRNFLDRLALVSKSSRAPSIAA